jgi:hypothetical protein
MLHVLGEGWKSSGVGGFFHAADDIFMAGQKHLYEFLSSNSESKYKI